MQTLGISMDRLWCDRRLSHQAALSKRYKLWSQNVHCNC